jgi:hypothetical protein
MNQTGEKTTVQDSQPRARKLTLARETLRSLGDATLARAAGGTFEAPSPLQPWGTENYVDETSASGF